MQEKNINISTLAIQLGVPFPDPLLVNRGRHPCRLIAPVIEFKLLVRLAAEVARTMCSSDNQRGRRSEPVAVTANINVSRMLLALTPLRGAFESVRSGGILLNPFSRDNTDAKRLTRNTD